MLWLSEHHFKQVQRFQCQQVTWRVSAWGRVADNSCFMQWASLQDKLQLSPSVRPSGLYVGVFMVDNLHRACVHQRAKDNLSLLMLLTHTDTQAHTHICPFFISECVCVTVCNSLCLEGSGGLGTVWKSHWASSGSSQSHGKQHWPKTTGIVQAAAWPPSITLFRLDIRHQPLP